MTRTRPLPHRGLAWPGDSWLHRAPVGVKVAVLVATSVAVIAIGRPWVSALIGAAALLAVRLAGVPNRAVLRQVVPIAVMAAIIALAQLVTGDPRAAVVVALRILAVACVAVVVTLTTTAPEMADWVERTLRRIRLPEGTVFRGGMLVGIALRSIDHLVEVVGSVREARRARGLQRSVRALAVPTVIAAARYAHGMGEALEARGLAAADDHPS